MQRMKYLTWIAALIFLLGQVALLSQSKENGAIEGKVIMGNNEALPGVQVIISSPNLMGGERSTVTDERGRFRFVALPPGVYLVKARLDGFQTAVRDDVRLSVGITLTIDFTMVQGRIEEAITVKGVPPLVDIKDSQTAVTNLSQDLIQNIPNNQFVSDIVNMAPGVKDDSAFGASTNGVQYQIDGVDTSDPELHTAYVFLDYGVVQEAKIMGIGAPAEYDGFSGIVFNTITKSGGNKFSGMFDSFLQLDKWNASNIKKYDYLETSPAMAYKNVHLDVGGPIVKDKLWFFGALQFYRSDRKVPGFPYAVAYDQPRSFLKLTWQPNRKDRIAFSYEGDLYTGRYRGADAYHEPEATRKQKSPELYFNLNWLHIYSDSTFLEAKAAGYMSYYKLIPEMGYDVSGYYDLGTLMSYNNSWTYYHAFRNRISANVSVSHHAENFIAGYHDFKFGLDTELNPTKTEWGYPNGKSYDTYYGEPYDLYVYDGYSTKAVNFRASLFAQDSWSVSDRLRINPGIRFNYYRGKILGVGTVFKPQIGIAPRIGVTYDLFGDRRTALKAHYGKYYDNIVTYYYTRLAPKPDLIYYYWDGEAYQEDWRVEWDPSKYTVDPDIKMPYMNQYTVGIERELMQDLSVGVNYIYRTNHDMIDKVALLDPATDFEMGTTTASDGTPITFYDQLDPGSEKYVITNPKKGQYPMVTFTPTRKYSGVEVVVNKRFANKWQLLASYTHGKATGSSDNVYDSWNSTSLGDSRMFSDLNYQVNALGRLTYDPTHMVKLQGSIILPLDINLGGYFSYISGDTYNRTYRVSTNQGRRYIMMESAGNLRHPAQTNLDLKLEKIFRFGNVRLGAMIDMFNVFNDDTITSVQNTFNVSGYNDVVSLVAPRVFRLGLRLFF